MLGKKKQINTKPLQTSHASHSVFLTAHSKNSLGFALLTRVKAVFPILLSGNEQTLYAPNDLPLTLVARSTHAVPFPSCRWRASWQLTPLVPYCSCSSLGTLTSLNLTAWCLQARIDKKSSCIHLRATHT